MDLKLNHTKWPDDFNAVIKHVQLFDNNMCSPGKEKEESVWPLGYMCLVQVVIISWYEFVFYFELHHTLAFAMQHVEGHS